MICLLCTGAQPTPTNKRKRKRRATASLFLVKKKKKKGGRAWRGAGLTTTSFSLPDCPFSPPLTGKADAVVHSSLPQVNLTFFYPNNNNNRPTIENLSGRFSWSNFGKFVWGGRGLVVAPENDLLLLLFRHFVFRFQCLQTIYPGFKFASQLKIK